MKKNLKFLMVAGARPNLMKIAPLLDAITRYNHIRAKSSRKIDCCLVYTGQHYDKSLSEVFWKDLGIPRPDFDLRVGSASHAVQTARIMVPFEKICLQVRPDLVIVVGDVNSTLACALVAAKLGIRVAHVESGLRSFDRSMPEEINRVLTDHLCDYLFVTEESGLKNLRREGIARGNIYYVGNVMIDTLIKFKKKALASDICQHLGIDSKSLSYVLLTLHRPSNVDDRKNLVGILKALLCLSKYITIIFPVHPRTIKMLRRFGLSKDFELHFLSRGESIGRNTINCIEPLSYLDFIKLLTSAKIVLTDSGGIQEESSILNIPCLTVRKNTERPSTIEKGTNILVGCSTNKIIMETIKILRGRIKKRKSGSLRIWDGKAAQRIVRILAKAS